MVTKRAEEIRHQDAASELGFAPWEVSFVADPYPVYTRLRDEHPVLYDEATDHWLVSRYEDVKALLRDRRFGRTYVNVATHAEMGRPEEPAWHAPFWWLIRNGILDMEPPDHTRVRRLVSKAFTPRMVERLKPHIQRIMDGLVDDVSGAGEIDLIRAIAEPLPVAVIAEMLGVPEGDRDLLRPWSAEICLMYELNPSDDYARRAVLASEEFTEYLRTLSRERRANPRDDLISALAQVVDEGERLTEGELIGTCVLLLNAGHEATVNVTGNGWWALFRNPHQLALLRSDHSLIPRAAGIHFCLGAPLARVELETSFGTLLRRLPDMQLVEEPEWKEAYIIRGLKELKVRL